MNKTNTQVTRTCLVHPLFDVPLVGGLSLLAYFGVLSFGPHGQSIEAARWAAVLMWAINWPHFSATLHRLFHRRSNMAQYPVTALVVTLVVLAGIAGSLASPAILAPFFVKLFLLWSPYHFSGQSVGISKLYAKRAGITLGRWESFALACFVYGTFLAPTLRAESSATGNAYYGIAYPSLGVPPFLGQAATVMMYAGLAFFLLAVIRRSISAKKMFPPMALLPAATQYAWFVAGASLPAFYVFVPLFHSLQYLPIAWAMHLGENAAGRGPQRAWRETVQWSVVNFAGGIGLFWLFPHAVSAMGVPLDFATGIVIAGVQIHHFFVDGVIWKLKSAHVGSALSADVGGYFRKQTNTPLRAAA